MRLPDNQKRRQIVTTAARLFASQPFHKVRLDEVAAAAGVGKGTLYTYFDSKEDLYFSLIYEGFADLIDRVKGLLADETSTAWEALGRIVRELVHFGFRHAHLFELMRTVGPPPQGRHDWGEKQRELAGLIEQTIRRGIQQGELADPHPELTTLFIPGLVRSAMLHGPKGLSEEALSQQILRILGGGILKKESQ